ncbi:MAG: S41 family peptidase [Cyclobacteriaceae bacterium]
MRSFITVLLAVATINATAQKGYYRFPTIHENIVIFTAEGDLWKHNLLTQTTQRLTTHLGIEKHADISPDGSLVAFSAQYDGPTEVYIMPIEGGLPKRLTYDGERASVIGWTPDNRVIYSTQHYSTLPNTQLVLVDPNTLEYERVPLDQASDGAYTNDMSQLYFVRQPFQGSQTKRYKGGTAQNLWKFDFTNEAEGLTTYYPGTSKNPMIQGNDLFFLCDNDGTMNLYSMPLGEKVGWLQRTTSKGWDLKEPDAQGGRVVYQKGADLYLFDVQTNQERKLEITLPSDFDQQRSQWITNAVDQISDVHISANGEKVAITSRGKVFSSPIKQGRFVEVTKKDGIRYRNAQFQGDSDELIFLSDESGEVEFWGAADNGMNLPKQLSKGEKSLIMDMVISPNGGFTAFWNKEYNLKIINNATSEVRLVDHSEFFGFGALSWSPDSKWLAYSAPAENNNSLLQIFNVQSNVKKKVTTDRLDSYGPAWSPDGDWLYFLSDRNFETIVGSPWGPRQPEPFYDKTTKIFALDLKGGSDFPFKEENELSNLQADSEEPIKSKKKRQLVYDNPSNPLNINGLENRLYEVPIGGGNRSQLSVNEEYLFWIETASTPDSKSDLFALKISNESDNPAVAIAKDISSYELSDDGSTLLVETNNALFVREADDYELDKEKDRVDLSNWKFEVDPKDEWRQMFVDAWRLMRDYFYDKNMHNVNWQAQLDKHLPLVERISDRDELDDLISHMVGELSALHHFVRSRDKRKPEVEIEVASLGVTFTRNDAQGGYLIEQIYQSDPDYPEALGPLSKPNVKIKQGDIITAINGVSTLSVDHISDLLRNQANKQVRLSIKTASGASFDEIVKPITAREERNLRYADWKLSRRKMVDEKSNGEIGYIHLSGMSGRNYIEFVKDFYPAFNRQGLIIDVRHNTGGNIDSWVLEKLMRKAWMYWQGREGRPYWNMQYAFRGYMVSIINEETASDGEAFAEGFRRLELGELIGTRTWGGEIWLSSSNRLVDDGIASAAEFGVYGPEGEWLIEGHGVDPDIIVDNLPNETFNGKDSQLDAAIDHLLEKIRKQPITVPKAPSYPNKQFEYEEN